MNRKYSACALALKAAEGRRTPRRWRVGQGHPNFRQVLECAAPATLWTFLGGSWFQCVREKGLSMNLKVGRASRLPRVGEAYGKFAFPLALSRSLGRRDACPTLSPLLFMVPLHAKKRKEGLHVSRLSTAFRLLECPVRLKPGLQAVRGSICISKRDRGLPRDPPAGQHHDCKRDSTDTSV